MWSRDWCPNIYVNVMFATTTTTKCKETKHYIFHPETKIPVCLVKCFSRCVCFFIQYFFVLLFVYTKISSHYGRLRVVFSQFFLVVGLCVCARRLLPATRNSYGAKWTTRNEMPVLNLKELSSRSTDNMGPRKLSSKKTVCIREHSREFFFSLLLLLLLCVFRENKNPSRWSNPNKHPQLRLGYMRIRV